MKNIYILPTEKSSKIGYIFESHSYHIYNTNELLNELSNPVNIYITSDEEIKFGDYIIKNNRVAKANYNGNELNPLWEKIIMTTDQKLIADGIQDIGDEFLKWFVENPTCEYVTVYDGLFGEDRVWKKYIIIPREKPKQFIGRGMKSLIGKDLHGINPPTTESLEEAANRIYPPNCNFQGEDSEYFERMAYINGGIWVMEKMYSEEDMKLSFEAGKKGYMRGSMLHKEYYFTWKNFKQWIEQFKKK